MSNPNKTKKPSRIGHIVKFVTRKTKKRTPPKVVLNLGLDLNAATETETDDETYYSASSYNIDEVIKNCPDSGVCLAFGRYSEDIKQMFDFTSFKHIDDESPINIIGEDSDNGFINQIAYSIKIEGLFGKPDYDYKAYAVLKSAQTENSDNLLYEFLVGEFINRQNLRFPCFLETYGLFKYKNEATWTQMQNPTNDKTILNPKNIETLLLKDAIHIPYDIPYDTACTQAKYLAILIQHLKGITTLDKKIKSIPFVSQDLLYVLFQIYVPLDLLKDNFTHYDLHLNNVVLYTPAKDKYIEYHYHFKDGKEVVFKSQYIAKLIDYGQSYFKDETTGMDSKKIYDALCGEPVCKNCGIGNGFLLLNLPPDNKYYVNSKAPNVSYDLMILNNIKQKFKSISYMKIPYIDNISVRYLTLDGTPEVKNTGLPNNQINNVQDAADYFISEVQKDDAQTINEDFYKRFTSLGQLHIYCNEKDKPMEFIPNVN